MAKELSWVRRVDEDRLAKDEISSWEECFLALS